MKKFFKLCFIFIFLSTTAFADSNDNADFLTEGLEFDVQDLLNGSGNAIIEHDTEGSTFPRVDRRDRRLVSTVYGTAVFSPLFSPGLYDVIVGRNYNLVSLNRNFNLIQSSGVIFNSTGLEVTKEGRYDVSFNFNCINKTGIETGVGTAGTVYLFMLGSSKPLASKTIILPPNGQPVNATGSNSSVFLHANKPLFLVMRADASTDLVVVSWNIAVASRF